MTINNYENKKQTLFILGCSLIPDYVVPAMLPILSYEYYPSQGMVPGSTWEVDADESLYIAEFSKRYSRNTERWNKVFHFLATTDLNTKNPGRYELDTKNLFIIIDEYVIRC